MMHQCLIWRLAKHRRERKHVHDGSIMEKAMSRMVSPVTKYGPATYEDCSKFEQPHVVGARLGVNYEPCVFSFAGLSFVKGCRWLNACAVDLEQIRDCMVAGH